MRLSSFFFLVVVVTTAQAYTILSERDNLVSINNALRQNKTITLRCTRSDFGVPLNLTVLSSVDNSSIPVQINVSATDITYDTQIPGYVPRHGRLERVQCCLARDGSRYNPENPAPEPTFSDFNGVENQTWSGGTSLQAVHDAHQYSLQEYRPPTARKLQFLGIALGGLLLVNEFFCFMKCPGKVDKWDPSLFDDFKNQSNNRLALLEQQNLAAQAWQNATNDNIVRLTLGLSDVRDTFATLNSTVGLLQERTSVNEQMFNASRVAIENEIGYMRSSLVGVNQAVANVTSFVTQLVGAQNDTLRLAMNYTERSLQNVQSTLTDMQNALLDRITKADERLRSLTDLVFRLSGQVREAVLNFEAQRCLTRKIQARIEDIQNEGLYVPFLENLGQQPASSLGPYRAVLIDAINLRYGFTFSGSYYLRRKIFTLECDTGFYLNRASDAMSWRDILENLGPLNCDPLQFGDCSCWITITSKQCATNQSKITSGILNSSLAFDLNASMCTSAISNDAVVTITSPNGILDYLRGQCLAEPFLTNTSAVLGGTLVAATYSVPHRSDMCDMILNKVFSNSQLNFVALMFDHWSNAYGIAVTRKDVYSRIVDGILPLNLTIKEEQFTRLKNGQPARCWNSYFMTYSTDWLPVYLFSNPRLSNTVSMKIGNGNVTTKTSDVSISQPYSFLLPSEPRIIGNPYSTTAVYDVDYEDFPLGATASGRLGKATYPMVPYSNMTNNLTAWRWWWGVDFEHNLGDNTAELYKRNVTGGFCDRIDYVTTSSWCALKDRFFFFQRNNTLVANAYDEVLQVTLTIPQGTVIANTFSDCPVAEVTPISGTQTMVKLSNNQAVPIVVAIVESGACSRTFPSITVGAGLSYEHLVPVCSTGNGQVFLTVSKYVGSDLEACASISGLNVTVNRAVLLNVRGVPDLRYVNEFTITDVDRLATSNALATSEIYRLLGTTLVAMLEGFQAATIVLPNKTYADVSGILYDLNQTQYATFERLANLTGRSQFNLTALSAPYQAQLDDINLRQAELNKRFSEQLANLTARVGNTTDIIQNLQTLLGAYQALQNAVVDAERNTTASLQRLLGNISASLTQLTQKDSTGFNLFSALGDVIEDVVDGTIDIGSDVGKVFYKLAKGIVDLAEKGAKGFLGIGAGLFKSLSNIATGLTYLIVVGFAVYMIYRCRQMNKKKKAAKAAKASPAPAPSPPPKPEATAKVTPAPAPAAKATPTPVASTKAGTDLPEKRSLLREEDEEEEEDEDDDNEFLSTSSWNPSRLHTSAVVYRRSS